MRSTTTFEPDVSSRFQRALVTHKRTRKALLNEVMRKGLDALEAESEPASKPFEIRVHDGGQLLDHRLSSQILAEMDVEDFLRKHRRSMGP